MAAAGLAAFLARFFQSGVAVLLSVWLAAISVVAWLVLQARAEALERGERSTAAFAAVVEQQTAGTFQAVNLTLSAVGDAHQLSRPARHDADFRRMMRRRLQDVPCVRALFIVGPEGQVINDADDPAAPDVSLASHAYFLPRLKDPGHPNTIWPPLESRSGTGWFLAVTRPLERGGEVQGVVVTAVQAEHFGAQFRRIGLDASYVVALFHLGGVLVARHPGGVDDIGKTFGHLPLFDRHLPQTQATFWTAAGLVPGEQVVSYRKVESLPLVLSVYRSKGDVLAEWRRAAASAAVGMLALTAFLAWFIRRLVRDQARRRRARDKRLQAEKLEALGQLTAGITHDIGNILQVVAANAEVLRRSPPRSTLADQALDAIERAVRSAAAILQRSLSFARQRPLAIARMRLDEWLDSAGPLLGQAAGPLVAIQCEIRRPLAEVWCDAAQLDAAMVNLILNARAAITGSGSVSMRAFPCDNDSGAPKAFVGSPAPFICLAVKDSGCGMIEEVRRRALDPFFSTKGEAGTGLGLTQVYGFVRQIGGDVTIESAPGRGTTVHLFFRVAGSQ